MTSINCITRYNLCITGNNLYKCITRYTIPANCDLKANTTRE